MCGCMHACMHVCTYVCTYVCVYVMQCNAMLQKDLVFACMHALRYAGMYVFLPGCLSVCMHVRMYVACMYVRMYVCMYVFVHAAYIFTCMHIDIAGFQHSVQPKSAWNSMHQPQCAFVWKEGVGRRALLGLHGVQVPQACASVSGVESELRLVCEDSHLRDFPVFCEVTMYGTAC